MTFCFLDNAALLVTNGWQKLFFCRQFISSKTVFIGFLRRLKGTRLYFTSMLNGAIGIENNNFVKTVVCHKRFSRFLYIKKILLLYIKKSRSVHSKSICIKKFLLKNYRHRPFAFVMCSDKDWRLFTWRDTSL